VRVLISRILWYVPWFIIVGKGSIGRGYPIPKF
jgi:hypothetical protein